jgi:hypothetical protein
MPEYFLAPSLVTFRNSINKEFPDRDKRSDGWIGDASHSARESEHNPCWECTGYQNGIVRATDTDIDDNDAGRDLRREILNAAVGHPAVWYVISNGIIYSRTYDFRARKYEGSNGHFAHVHISINKNERSAKDLTLILKTLAPIAVPDVTIDARALNYAASGKGFNPTDVWFGDCKQFMAWAANPKIGVITIGQRDAYTNYVVVKRDFAYAGRMMKVTIQKVQAMFNLKPDGIVGPKTARVLRAYGYNITGSL